MPDGFLTDLCKNHHCLWAPLGEEVLALRGRSTFHGSCGEV